MAQDLLVRVVSSVGRTVGWLARRCNNDAALAAMMELRKVFLIVPRKLEVHSSNSNDSTLFPQRERRVAAASQLQGAPTALFRISFNGRERDFPRIPSRDKLGIPFK
jgi:hypothetical protein